MAIASNVLPSKCCCCSLRAGSIVVGSFCLVVALTFLGLCATASSLMNQISCKERFIDNMWKTECERVTENDKMMVNQMALLSILNAVEVIMSVGLIWGASKRIMSWVTAWLITSACWILLHGTVAIAFLFATKMTGFIILISILGILILGMALISMLTVYSFRKEMKNSLCLSSVHGAPTALSSDVERQPALWSGHTQQPIVRTYPSAPAVS